MRSEQDSIPENTLLPDPIMTTQHSSNLQHKSMQNLSTPTSRNAFSSFMDLIRDLWNRLGSPMAQEGFSLVPVKVESFGRRRSIKGSRRR